MIDWWDLLKNLWIENFLAHGNSVEEGIVDHFRCLAIQKKSRLRWLNAQWP